MEIVLCVVFVIVGLVIGYAVSHFVVRSKQNKSETTAADILRKAKSEADSIKRDAEIEAKENKIKVQNEADREIAERKREISQQENRLMQREDSLDKRSNNLDKREYQLSSLQGQIEKKNKELDDALVQANEKLEQIASLTPEQAKEVLIERVKGECTKKAASIIRQAEAQANLEADRKARNILSLAIQRMADEQTSEQTISSIPIPSDDLKGRIIGREGRNIRTFEQITGVNLIIDDTPELVVISCFDPVRREIGRITIENLIADGRIHPARIEEMFNKATKLVGRQIQEAGEKAAFEIGIHDFDPEIIKTLGRLKFRTSYGQNVLQHSVEVAHLSSMMASELGLDPAYAKRAGLLHDIGKALDHEIEGSHAVIGADLIRRFGEETSVVHAVEAHHNDVEPQSVVAVLVQAADAISAARPGARSESMENYVKRLEKLEEIANTHEGVDHTYVMQAGREIRVMVEPDKINDSQQVVMAHEIAKQIEEEMQYPGQIKVVVIRESRAQEIAK